MALVGPGSIKQEEVAPKPLLEGVSEYEYITILNPLTDDFAIAVAQDVPVNMPFEIRKDGKTSVISNTEQDVRNTYGLSLKNPDYQARKHIQNQTIIPAGKTINLKGDDAQVAVRQLVSEIIQREGKQRLLHDPNLRRSVESRIILNRGSIQDIMDNNLVSVKEQAAQAVNRLNEASNEEAFPGLSNSATGSNETGSSTAGDDSTAQQKRTAGRPRKNQDL